MKDKSCKSDNCQHKSAKEIAKYEAELKKGLGKNTAKAVAFDTKKPKKDTNV